MEDECAAVCYPIVKPLLRYFEKCQETEVQRTQWQDKYTGVLKEYSDLQKKYYEALEKVTLLDNNETKDLKFDEVNLKYKKSELRNQQKDRDIASLKAQIFFSTKSDEDKLPQPNNWNNIATNVKALPDRCPRRQNKDYIIQEVQIPGSGPFKVCCQSDPYMGAGWMLVFQKVPYSLTFNRTYENYTNGFGEVGVDWDTEIFIGLERLHLLTNREAHEVLVYVYPYLTSFLMCDNFVVGHKHEGYMVKVAEGCTGNYWLGPPTEGNKFSAFDRDEDGDPHYNWAKVLGFGWWYDARCVLSYFFCMPKWINSNFKLIMCKIIIFHFHLIEFKRSRGMNI